MSNRTLYGMESAVERMEKCREMKMTAGWPGSETMQSARAALTLLAGSTQVRGQG